jgi:diguanylate cyclase (GGDEF)-like protein/PAS domain S-box-containing protein
MTMRLSSFILENMETILQEWEDFAATLVAPEHKTDRVMLRDHVKKMMLTIATDLARPQTAHEQAEKSKGHDDPSVKTTAAEAHGTERLALGFSLNEAMAEYRALRASVTRLWEEAFINKPVPNIVIDDLIRFNEAIDQAITESVTSYSFEKEQQARVLDTILSSSPDLSFTVNLDGTFAYANKALTNFLDLPLNEVVGKSFYLDLPSAAGLQHQIQEVIRTKEKFQGEMSYTAPAGREGFYDYIFVPVLNKEGAVEAVAGTAHDITERKAAEDKNWKKANYDLLTGLPNRRLFNDRLKQELKHARRIGAPIALLFVDLDHFKETNDTFGHDAGDLLLQLAADRIRSCVRETDTVARLGGDEFTVILQDLTDTKHAEIVAGKIVRELASPFPIAKEIIHSSASIGIALSSQDASTPEILIKNADLAMYVSKGAGRNRFSFFSPNQENVLGKAS